MFWIPLAAAAITAAGSAMSNRANNKAVAAEGDKQRAFDLDMWSRTNAFNKEQAQWEFGNNNFMRAQDWEWAQQASAREFERQKEFAQMGIQWRAQDAQAAGLHPLAVLGGAGASYSPSVALPGSYPSPSVRAAGMSRSGGGGAVGHSAAGTFLSEMGQNIMRSMVATETAEQRERRELELEHLRLRNRLVDAQITETYSNIMGQPQTPPFPSPGGPVSPTGAIKVEPSRSVSHLPGSPHMEAARTPFGKTFDMGGGASIVLPSQAAAESLEALGPFAGPTALTLSGLRHWFHGPAEPPKASLPPGWTWKWSPLRQAFQPIPPATAPDLSGFGTWRGGRGNAPTRRPN